MLKIIQTHWGEFDLAVEDGSDQSALETLVYAALFTDAQAPTERVADTYDQRGWWADPQAGSKLWYIRRQALTEAARRETIDAIRTALSAHGITEIQISEAPTDAAGTVSRLSLLIEGRHNGRAFTIKVPL